LMKLVGMEFSSLLVVREADKKPALNRLGLPSIRKSTE
jgi:hypothetical protein